MGCLHLLASSPFLHSTNIHMFTPRSHTTLLLLGRSYMWLIVLG